MIIEFDIFKPYSKIIEQGVVKDLSEIPGAVLAWQVHGDKILEVDEKPKEQPKCDAFMTNKKGLPIMVKIADCQGVLIFDPTNEAIAAVHSGWKGSIINIIGKTIEKMRLKYGSDPQNLIVAVSPSLGPCCAEFTDPNNELPGFCKPFIKPNKHVDFWALTRFQLTQAGVPKNQIEITAKCTKCQPGYYSYRNGDSQRMGVFVKLK